MFDFFKNLFVGKEAESDNVFQSPSTPRQVPLASMRPPGAPAFRSQDGRQVSPGQGGQATVQSEENPGEGQVNIPLGAVLCALPLELKARVRSTNVGNTTLAISLDRVLSQLPQGAVRLPFGELRNAAPELFTTNADADQAPVALPLNEILSRINPATMIRRPNQKHLEVPAEISSPFGDEIGNNLASPLGLNNPTVMPSTHSIPPRNLAAPAPAEQKPLYQRPIQAAPTHPQTPAGSNPFQSLPKAPAAVPAAPIRPAPFSPIRTPEQNAAPAASPMIPIQPVPMRNSITSMPTPAAPSTVPEAEPESIPMSSALRALETSFGTSGPTNGSRIQPYRAVATKPESATLAVEGPTLEVSLASLSDLWPEALREEIVRLRLVGAQVALPMAQIEEAMKRGKVAFAWKTLRSWIKPSPLPSISVHDTAMLELPLRVVAPLFLARKKEASVQQKVAIDENIPNLFFGFPQAEAAAPAPARMTAPTAPTSQPVTPAAPLSHPVAKPVETNFYVWDDSSDSARVDETEFKRQPTIETNFLSRYATPNEVVARASVMEGVAGSLVALPDGLMVASKLPAELNGDTLAAFLPQIFGKVSQCTRELRMGELNNLSFTVGNVPWKIFRVNAIFFAAFGRAGQGLPTAQLSALAAELDRKKPVS